MCPIVVQKGWASAVGDASSVMASRLRLNWEWMEAMTKSKAARVSIRVIQRAVSQDVRFRPPEQGEIGMFAPPDLHLGSLPFQVRRLSPPA